jgi:hypothetical protein
MFLLPFPSLPHPHLLQGGKGKIGREVERKGRGKGSKMTKKESFSFPSPTYLVTSFRTSLAISNPTSFPIFLYIPFASFST